MKCSICGKKVPSRYIKAHQLFHKTKAAAMVIKAAKGLKLHAFDKEVK